MAFTLVMAAPSRAAGLFDAVTLYSVETGTNPLFVAAGDFNGDGMPDIVVANYGSGTISILLGSKSGAFGAASSFAVGTTPYSISVGDFNEDGQLDIAVANNGSGDVSILLGNGTGIFAPAVNYSVGSNPSIIITGDFNGDAISDLAVANSGSNTISILLGNGDGTFQTAINCPVGTTPLSLVSGYFNDDGNVDLAVANYTEGSVSILKGNGNGSFQSAIDYFVGAGPHSITAGDFDGDGKVDLVTANYGSNNVSMLKGNGDGSFQAAVNYATGLNPFSVISGDFDGDGILDIAVANYGSSNISILTGDGLGGFAPEDDYPVPVGSGPYALVTADFNIDGKPDLAVAAGDGATISVMLNTTVFLPAMNYVAGVGPWAIVNADFNGDGNLDVAVVNLDGNNVTVMMGDGNGIFSAATATDYPVGIAPIAIVAGDFTGDGKPDLAVANYGENSVSILKNNGDGTFVSLANYPVGNLPRGIATGDLNGDGKLDLVLSNSGSDSFGHNTSVSFLQGNGDGTFLAAVDYNLDAVGLGAGGITTGDFTSDGVLDVAVVLFSYSNQVAVLPGMGNGTFAAAQAYSVGDRPLAVISEDFNGDGFPDLAVVNYVGNSVSILQGKPDGTFLTQVTYGALGNMQKPYAVALGDFNNDGMIDIVTPNFSSNNVTMFKGNGDSTFQKGVAYATGTGAAPGPVAVAAGDFNNDGRIDLAVANYMSGSNNVSILLNRPDLSPEQFTFADQSGKTTSTLVTSNTITVRGINVPAPISIINGEYSINGGPYTSATGTILNGQSVTVRKTTAPTLATTAIATLTIGAVSDTFCVSTDHAPTATNLNAPEVFTEDAALSLSHIVVSDTDSAAISASLTLSDPAAGTLSTGTTGSVTSTFSGGIWTASGAKAGVNAQLAGVMFTPAANYELDFSIEVSIDDGIAPAITGTKSVTAIPVNDPPSFTKGANQNVNASDGAQIVPNWATNIVPGPAPYESLQLVDFIVSTASTTLFSAQPAVDAAGTLTYSPMIGVDGVATVTVRAHDNGGTANGGVALSSAQTFSITIQACNTAPSFTTGPDQILLEDAGAQTVMNWATNISPGSPYPGPASENGQTISFVISGNTNTALFSVQPVINTLTGTLTYTPAANANGVATVTMYAHDNGGTVPCGTDTSAPRTFTITVTPVNDAPVFTKGASQTVAEDAGPQTVTAWASGISAGPANESGQTIDFIVTNNNNALFAVQPAIDASGNLTYTPAADANGGSLVTVRAHDDGGTTNGGIDLSTAQTFTVTIWEVNDIPSAVDDAKNTLEDTPLIFAASTLAANDSPGPANESGQTLLVTAVSGTSSQGGIISLVSGTITYIPPSNYNGADTFTYTIRDNGTTQGVGDFKTATATVTVTVTGVNDPPSFTKGADQTVAEDAGMQTVSTWATAIFAGPANESGQSINFMVSNNNTALFSAQPAIDASGNLTFTPAADANGSATVTVQAHDDGGTLSGGNDTSAAQTFTITVWEVNDLPTAAGDAKATLEDTPLIFAASTLTVNDSPGPANESSQTLTVTAVASPTANGGIVSLVSGTVTYTPALNFNGSDTFTYTVSDNGTTNSSADFKTATAAVTVTVTGVNDPPSFTKGADQLVAEDSGVHTVAAWASAISKGPSNESFQTVDFIVTNNNNPLFSTQPAIDAAGNLTYTLAADANGSATVTVQAHDDGGTANGGIDTSASQTFAMTVWEVNDDPVAVDDIKTTLENTALVFAASTLKTNDSRGPANESTQTLTVTAVSGTSSQGGVVSLAGGSITYTPVPDFNGADSFTYTITDNGTTHGVADAKTATATVTVTVIPVNNPPSFTAGSNIAGGEDEGAITLPGWATAISAGPADESGQTIDFIVTNDSNPLFSAQPAVSATGTLTFTPAANANGNAKVTVRAHDNGGTANGGSDTSAAQTFYITVFAINDPPSFAKGADQIVAEDSVAQTIVGWATAISAGPADESGQAIDFIVTNDNNSLFSAQPAVSATGTLMYTPAANANGVALVTLRAHDSGGTVNGGSDTSASQTFLITINPSNDPPSFVKGSDQSLAEDSSSQSVTGWATAISAGPANETGQIVTFIVANDNNALFAVQPAISAAGTLTYTPAANANGSAIVTVQAHDNGGTANGGVDTSAAQTFTIALWEVNDPPVAAGDATTTMEDTPLELAASALTVNDSPGPANENGQALLVTAVTGTSTQGGLVSLISGTIMYTPPLNFNGTDTFTYTVTDNGTTHGVVDPKSATAVVTVFVTAVNDPPTFAKGADQTITEDAGAQTVAAWATSIAPGSLNESPQVVDFIVTTNNNGLFSSPPSIDAAGNLRYTTAPDAIGAALVTVRAHDDGGTANGGIDTSAPQTFTITVIPVNDAPSFTKGPDQSAVEDSGTQTVAAWATAIAAGPSDESGQVVDFLATNNNNVLFSVQPAVDAAGTLTYTLAANANGAATVTVRAHDNGGLANGGSDTSASQTFVISITAVNDLPSFIKGADQAAAEDSGTQTVVGWASSISAGPVDESAQTINFIVTNNNTALFSLQPAINASGVLTYTPAPDANGSAVVTVQAHDNGGTANGGVDLSSAQTFTITLWEVNDPPLAVDDAAATLEDAPLVFAASTLLANDARGPANESGQTLLVTAVSATSTQGGVVSLVSGTITYTPPLNFNGNDSFTYTVQDNGTTNGGADYKTATAVVTVAVSAVNDPPSFIKGANQTILEDAGVQTVTNWATAITAGMPNESAQVVDFIVTNNNTSLFSAQPSIDASGTLTYISAANANGLATVTVKAHDNGGTAFGGNDTSAAQTFTITVTPVNDPPVFTKGADQTIGEDSPAQTVAAWATTIAAGPADETGQAVDFIVTNNNNALFSVQPAIDASGALTYTPTANANGSALVTVRAHDNGGTLNGGINTSAPQTFLISMVAVNDPPSFTKGADQLVAEDSGAQTATSWATAISAGPADESTQTVTFIVSNNNTTLFSVQPSIDASGNLTYTPAPDANGSATVTVQAHDNGGTAGGGNDTSAPQTFAITVWEVNDTPTAVDDVKTTLEDSLLTFPASDLVANDSAGPANESGQTLVVTSVSGTSSQGGTVSLVGGAITFTPVLNFNGTDTFTYTVADNGTTHGAADPKTATATVTITIIPVNDPPSFAKGADPATLEDAGLQTVAGFATLIVSGPANEAGQTVDFIVTNNNNALFAVQPSIDASGTLTYTPAPDANGSATVTVKAHDNGGTTNGGVDTSAPQTFTITVTPVNDMPSFTKGTDQTTLEDAGLQTVAGWIMASSTGPVDESGQAINYLVTNDNNTLFSSQPAINAAGTLTYTTALNANGVATVTVRAHDSGGTTNGGVDTSAPQTFLITITPVNDPPSFTKGVDQLVAEDSPVQTVAGWATAISAGPANENGQLIDFIVSNDNNSLFSIPPAISASGTLTYAPAANANGSAVVTIWAHDNGGTMNGGIDTSTAQTFTITLWEVNDSPLAIDDAATTLEDTPLVFAASTLTANDSPGPLNENSQSLLVTAVSGTSTQGGVVSLVSGTITYTPPVNFNGVDTFTYTVTDNGTTHGVADDKTATAMVAVTVAPVNDAPSFIKGANQAVAEDSGAATLAGWATAISTGPNDSGQNVDFIVTNDNNSLFSAQPAIDASGNLTFTPAPDSNGSALVIVKAHDNGGTANGGIDTSAGQTFTITVWEVNDSPLATGDAKTTAEDTALTFPSNDLLANDTAGPSNENIQTLTVTIVSAVSTQGGTVTLSGPGGNITYTPPVDFNGTDTFTYTVFDNGTTHGIGDPKSGTATVTITVTEVNDAPILIGDAKTVLEDAVLTFPSTDLLVNDSAGPANESGMIFTVTAVSAVSTQGGTVTLSAGNVSYTPPANFNGTDTFTYTVTDNGTTNGILDAKSASSTVTVTVLAVNDPPTFTKGSNQTVLEDASAQTAANWATAISVGPPNESTQTVDAFLVTNDNNPLFSVQPAIDASGALTYTPAANANGSATVTVKAHDTGGTVNGGVDTSVAQTFTITVLAVNDPPVFTKGADQAILEDAGAQTVISWATAISVGSANESGQIVDFIVTNNNNALFAVQPAIDASGTLTYTPAANANGIALVTVKAHDSGGTTNGGVDTSGGQTFAITVTPVNDAPSFTKGTDQTAAEDAGAQAVPGWATAVSAGPADESAQSIAFIVTNDNTALFSVQPAVSASGSLTYTLAAHMNGVATVTVKAHDNGGTTNNGVDTSAPQTFTITVTPVNDPPTFTKGADQTVAEDSGAQSAANWGTLISAGPVNEATQIVDFIVTNNNNALFTVQPAIDASGKLTYTPAPDANGSATVSVSAHDNGGTAANGVDTSAPQTFVITVTEVNDPPTAMADAKTTAEDTQLVLPESALTANDLKGPSNESTQKLTVTSVSAASTQGGNVTLSAGNITYTPAANFNGTDTFTYTVTDNGTTNGVVDPKTSTATVTVTVTEVNDAPIAGGDTRTAFEGTQVSFVANSLLVNDLVGPSNESGQTLSIAAVSALSAKGGTVTLANGSITYAPPANYNGLDSFTYTLADNGTTNNAPDPKTSTGTVNITISPSNGDMNSDGVVDSRDALKALRIAAGIVPATSSELAHGDVAPMVGNLPQPDNKIDLGDVIVILRKSVGLVSW